MRRLRGGGFVAPLLPTHGSPRRRGTAHWDRPGDPGSALWGRRWGRGGLGGGTAVPPVVRLASGWRLVCLRVMPMCWQADGKSPVLGCFPGSKHRPDANVPPHVAPTPLSSPAPGEGPAGVTPARGSSVAAVWGSTRARACSQPRACQPWVRAQKHAGRFENGSPATGSSIGASGWKSRSASRTGSGTALALLLLPCLAFGTCQL